MNAKEQRFIDEYLKDQNATAAALRAGYKRSTAKMASHWINENSKYFKSELYKIISEKELELMARNKVDQDRVVRTLISIMESDIRKLAGVTDLSEIPDEIAPAVSSMKKTQRHFGEDGFEETIEFKLWPKTSATQQLGSYLKMFFHEKGHQKEYPQITRPPIGEA